MRFNTIARTPLSIREWGKFKVGRAALSSLEKVMTHVDVQMPEFSWQVLEEGIKRLQGGVCCNKFIM